MHKKATSCMSKISSHFILIHKRQRISQSRKKKWFHFLSIFLLAPCTASIFGASSAVVELINLNFHFVQKQKANATIWVRGDKRQARHDDSKSPLLAAFLLSLPRGYFCRLWAIRILLAYWLATSWADYFMHFQIMH